MAVNLAHVATYSQSAAQDITTLRQVFEKIRADSCPTLFNFHMHTVCSDGQLQPEMLVQQAIAIGLKGFAITDHHTVDGYRIAQRWLNEQHSSSNTGNEGTLPHLWVGVEITSRLLETEVHILGYGFNPDSADMQLYLQRHSPKAEDGNAEKVIAAIHAAGGMAVLAHPVRYRKPPEALIPEAARLGIDGVETYYAYNNPNPWQPSPYQTKQVQRLSAAYKLLGTCGTDTHGLSLLQRL